MRYKCIKAVILTLMLTWSWHINAQEMKIWANGELKCIKDTIYSLPLTPPDSNMRYIEFTDFVLEVTVRHVEEDSVDCIEDYKRNNAWEKIPLKMVEIDKPKIYYRFTVPVGDSIGDINPETCTYEKHLAEVPTDSDVASVRKLLIPVDLDIPIGSTCLVWVIAVFKDVYYVIDVVDKNTIFTHRLSDYWGTTRPDLQIYFEMKEQRCGCIQKQP